MLDVKDITNYIFVSDEPCNVDAIFVVGGSLPKAAELIGIPAETTPVNFFEQSNKEFLSIYQC